jgi:hypothetical protein
MKVEGPFDSLRGIDLGLFVWSITKGGGGDHYGRDPPASILLHSTGAWPEFRPDSSLFELLPRTQTGRSQLSWTGQVRRDPRGTGEGVSIDLF